MSKDWNSKYNRNKSLDENKTSKVDDFELFMELSEYHKPVDVEAGWNKITNRISPNRNSFSDFWKIAAIIVLGLFIGGIAYQYQNNEQDQATVVSALELNKTITLPDGSEVTLARGSQLSYQMNSFTESRLVKLEGEAFFDVIKMKGSFRVESKAGEVEVLGTSFNVNALTDLKVTVSSGVVKVSYEGQEAIVDKGKSAKVLSSGVIDIFITESQNELSWKTGYFSFEEQSLDEVIPLLEKYYDVKISTNRALRSCQITATFDQSSLSNVVDVIGSVLNAKTKISGKKVRITGKGCN